MNRIQALSDRLKERHETLWQLLSFFLMGGFTMAVDLGSFALCNYLLFAAYRQTPFHFWLLNYGTENGGLCAFLAFAVSFAVSQTFNFFLQRKTTFRANNNPVVSGILYAVMVVGLYVFILWLPTVIGAWVYGLLGAAKGATVLKLLSEFLSACIQFPINKYIIMRKTAQ